MSDIKHDKNFLGFLEKAELQALTCRLDCFHSEKARPSQKLWICSSK